MYPKIKNQNENIAGIKSIKVNRVIVRAFVICLFYLFDIGIYNYVLAQTEDTSFEEKFNSYRLENQRIQELINSQPVSTFAPDELKKNRREKHRQEMRLFNQKRNQNLRAIFERFQKIRSQPVIYKGKHYDYTTYNQYFQAAPSR